GPLPGEGRGRRGDAEIDLAGGERAVNWQHFRAFLWLRWRLRVNLFKRGGTLNAVVFALMMPVLVLLAGVLVVVLLLVGVFAMLVVLPLVAAFALAVTALTYQFQGWLASMMVNPRRRRTVIVLLTAGFILLFQLPNLINIMRPWDDAEDNPHTWIAKEQSELH